MKKKLKIWGKGLAIYFDKEDIAIFGLVEGDVIDIDDMVVQKRTKKKEVKN
jgi:hypothetical protein